MLVNYQRSLGIKYAGSVTLLALLILVSMALETAVSNDFPFQFEPDDLWSRVMITCLWVVIQIVLLCVGVVTNVVLPCAFFTLSAISFASPRAPPVLVSMYSVPHHTMFHFAIIIVLCPSENTTIEAIP